MMKKQLYQGYFFTPFIRSFIKLTASLVLPIFAVTSVISSPSVFALGSLPELKLNTGPALLTELPAAHGKITSWRWEPASLSPSFIHIQDAHANASAQENIRKMLHWIDAKCREQGLSLEVAIEGASGEIHPEYFDLIPGQIKAGEKAVRKLAAQGELSGADLFAWDLYKEALQKSAGQEALPVKIYGAETPALYSDNLKTFRQLLEERNHLKKLLQPLNASLEREASRVLSSGLRTFLKERRLRKHGDYGSGVETPQWETWLPYLAKSSKNILSIDLSNRFEQIRFPQMVRVLMLQKLRAHTAKADLPEAERQKEEILKKLRKVAVTSETRALVESFSRLKKNANPRLTAEAVWRLSEQYRLSLADYEAFWKQTALVILSAEIHVDLLDEEMSWLEGEIVKKLAVQSSEKAVVNAYERMVLLEELLTLEMPRKHFEMIGQESSLVQLLKNEPYLEKKIDEKLFDYEKTARQFYQGALQRDDVLSDLAFGHRPVKSVVVLIAGGFHTAGIENRLRSMSSNYAVIRPVIDRIDHGEAYHRVLEEKNADLSAYMAAPGLNKQEAIFLKAYLETALPVLTEGQEGTSEAVIAKQIAEAMSGHPVLKTKLRVTEEITPAAPRLVITAQKPSETETTEPLIQAVAASDLMQTPERFHASWRPVRESSDIGFSGLWTLGLDKLGVRTRSAAARSETRGHRDDHVFTNALLNLSKRPPEQRRQLVVAISEELAVRISQSKARSLPVIRGYPVMPGQTLVEREKTPKYTRLSSSFENLADIFQQSSVEMKKLADAMELEVEESDVNANALLLESLGRLGGWVRAGSLDEQVVFTALKRVFSIRADEGDLVNPEFVAVARSVLIDAYDAPLKFENGQLVLRSEVRVKKQKRSSEEIQQLRDRVYDVFAADSQKLLDTSEVHQILREQFPEYEELSISEVRNAIATDTGTAQRPAIKSLKNLRKPALEQQAIARDRRQQLLDILDREVQEPIDIRTLFDLIRAKPGYEQVSLSLVSADFTKESGRGSDQSRRLRQHPKIIMGENQYERAKERRNVEWAILERSLRPMTVSQLVRKLKATDKRFKDVTETVVRRDIESDRGGNYKIGSRSIRRGALKNHPKLDLSDSKDTKRSEVRMDVSSMLLIAAAAGGITAALATAAYKGYRKRQAAQFIPNLRKVVQQGSKNLVGLLIAPDIENPGKFKYMRIVQQGNVGFLDPAAMNEMFGLHERLSKNPFISEGDFMALVVDSRPHHQDPFHDLDFAVALSLLPESELEEFESHSDFDPDQPRYDNWRIVTRDAETDERLTEMLLESVEAAKRQFGRSEVRGQRALEYEILDHFIENPWLPNLGRHLWEKREPSLHVTFDYGHAHADIRRHLDAGTDYALGLKLVGVETVGEYISEYHYEVIVSPEPSSLPSSQLTGADFVALDKVATDKLSVTGVHNFSGVKDEAEKMAQLAKLNPTGILIRSNTKVTDAFLTQLKAAVEALGNIFKLEHVIRLGHGLDNVSFTAEKFPQIKVRGTKGSAQSISALALRMTALAAERHLEQPSVAKQDQAPVLSFLPLESFRKASAEKIAKRPEGERVLLQAKSNEMLVPVSDSTIASLRGRVVGVIGAGNIGEELIARYRELGMEIWVNSRTMEGDPSVRPNENTYRFAEKDEIYQAADFIVVLTGLSPVTKGMIGDHAIELMSKNPNLKAVINPDRGKIVDEAAMARLLERQDNRVLYLVDEVPETESLRRLALYTDHIGGTTAEAENSIREIVDGILTELVSRSEVRGSSGAAEMFSLMKVNDFLTLKIEKKVTAQPAGVDLVTVTYQMGAEPYLQTYVNRPLDELPGTTMVLVEGVIRMATATWSDNDWRNPDMTVLNRAVNSLNLRRSEVRGPFEVTMGSSGYVFDDQLKIRVPSVRDTGMGTEAHVIFEYTGPEAARDEDPFHGKTQGDVLTDQLGRSFKVISLAERKSVTLELMTPAASAEETAAVQPVLPIPELFFTEEAKTALSAYLRDPENSVYFLGLVSLFMENKGHGDTLIGLMSGLAEKNPAIQGVFSGVSREVLESEETLAALKKLQDYLAVAVILKSFFWNQNGSNAMAELNTGLKSAETDKDLLTAIQDLSMRFEAQDEAVMRIFTNTEYPAGYFNSGVGRSRKELLKQTLDKLGVSMANTLLSVLAKEEKLPESVQMIIVFGSSDQEQALEAAKLYKAGKAPKILVSGRYGFHIAEDGRTKPEADVYRDLLIENGVPAEAIIVENQSRHMGQNAEFSYKLLSDAQAVPESAIFIHSSILTARGLDTAAQHFTDTRFYAHAAPVPKWAGLSPEQKRELIEKLETEVSRIEEFNKALPEIEKLRSINFEFLKQSLAGRSEIRKTAEKGAVLAPLSSSDFVRDFSVRAVSQERERPLISPSARRLARTTSGFYAAPAAIAREQGLSWEEAALAVFRAVAEEEGFVLDETRVLPVLKAARTALGEFAPLLNAAGESFQLADIVSSSQLKQNDLVYALAVHVLARPGDRLLFYVRGADSAQTMIQVKNKLDDILKKVGAGEGYAASRVTFVDASGWDDVQLLREARRDLGAKFTGLRGALLSSRLEVLNAVMGSGIFGLQRREKNHNQARIFSPMMMAEALDEHTVHQIEAWLSSRGMSEQFSQRFAAMLAAVRALAEAA